MIPMVDLKKQFDEIMPELMPALNDVIMSMRYVLGPNVEEFEKEVSSYIGTSHAIGVASGTDALHLAVKSLGIKPGDEVITTPFTFFATVESIIYEGAVPVFADIDPDTFNISPVKIEDAITSKTKAIIPVHMFGYPADMRSILQIAKRHELHVIEDCAQSFGASIGGIKTGAFGNAGCFSFYPSKNLGACGDGGMITLKESSIADDIKKLRNHGSAGGYIHDTVGLNSRLDELQAVILRIKLKQIDKYNSMRMANAMRYTSLLSSTVKCPSVPSPDHVHVYHQYTITSPKRNEIQKRLHDEGIASTVYYPVPMHLQPALRHLGYKDGDFPNAERASREVLSLPMCPSLEEGTQLRIAEIIKRV